MLKNAKDNLKKISEVVKMDYSFSESDNESVNTAISKSNLEKDSESMLEKEIDQLLKDLRNSEQSNCNCFIKGMGHYCDCENAHLYSASSMASRVDCKESNVQVFYFLKTPFF